MADFHFRVKPKVWIGPDTLLKLPLLAGEYSPEGRVLLIVDPLLYETKTIDRVRSLLEDRGLQILVFDEIPERATSRNAEDALRIARGSKSPLVIGLGGIKTLMLARAAASIAPCRQDLDAVLDGAQAGPSYLPLIEIPTSFRHGFLTEECFFLPDARDGRVRLVRSVGAAPSAVLVDPNLSAGHSPKVAASCLIDGLMGAIESYVSSKSSFLSDLVLEKAVSSLASSLNQLIARPDDPTARTEAWKGSFLASLGQGMSAPGIGTAVALAANAKWGVPKASLAAILLPYSIEFAAKSRLEKVAALCPLLGEDSSGYTPSEAAAKTTEWLRTKLGVLRIPSRLKDFDLSLDRLVETARDARELDFVNHLPRAVSVDDVFDFMKTAY